MLIMWQYNEKLVIYLIRFFSDKYDKYRKIAF